MWHCDISKKHVVKTQKCVLISVFKGQKNLSKTSFSFVFKIVPTTSRKKKETFLFFSTLKLLRQKASHNNIIDGAGGGGTAGKPFLESDWLILGSRDPHTERWLAVSIL